MQHYRTAYDSRRPLLGSTTAFTNTNEQFTYEFGIFPLRRGGQCIEQFVAIEDYFGLAKIVQIEPRRDLAIAPAGIVPRATRIIKAYR